jgi:hypothetical protein
MTEKQQLSLLTLNFRNKKNLSCFSNIGGVEKHLVFIKTKIMYLDDEENESTI